VRWAERRAHDFKDDALLKRAKKVEADALRIEANLTRLSVDAPQKWLEMALDARRRQVPEPGPSALAHRALRAKLAAASDIAALKATMQAIESFFPNVATDRQSAVANLASWEAAYANNPEAAYLSAPQHTRTALDRRLWADATERLLEMQSTGDLQSAIELSERAETLLPEKPKLAAQLIEKAAGLARQNLGKAREAEVKALALLYREKLHQPDEALNITRDWLKIQSEKLSKTDAEGPLLLANLYEELLEDRVTAVELLRKAWRIDPKSTEIAEAFRSRGFRKVKDEWIESTPTTEKTSVVVERGLRGLTSDEVIAKMGTRPEKVSYVASRGQLIEQWIYQLDNKMVRYVNLLHTPGDLKPRVIADYQLPRLLLKGGS
jgi:tetratricopeptide (TPR) repeat protein